MSRIVIDLPVPCQFGVEKVVPAALLFDIAPHLAGVGTFAVHPTVEFGGWVVSNVETGGAISESVDPTWADAVRRARKFLATKTEKDFRRAMRKFAKAYLL